MHYLQLQEKRIGTPASQEKNPEANSEAYLSHWAHNGSLLLPQSMSVREKCNWHQEAFLFSP